MTTTPPGPSLPPPESLTLVCCVESGWLEPLTVLLVESLRRWGGAFARCPVLAVTPRFGPPLGRSTRQDLERLGAEHVQLRGQPYSWFRYLNKPRALLAAEERARTPLVAWLDSDILVMGELPEMALPSEADFAACAPDRNIGSTGRDDPFDRYWAKLAEVFGVDLESLPWVVTEEEQARIRLYWNSGVFVWRRGLDFPRRYHDDCVRLLESKVASSQSGIFFIDQVTLGFTVTRMGLRWRSLPYAYNYGIGSKTLDVYDPAKFRGIRLLHYHDAFWPDCWEKSLTRIKEERPDIEAWLRQQGPLRNTAPWTSRALNKVMGFFRERKVKAYESLCERF